MIRRVLLIFILSVLAIFSPLFRISVSALDIENERPTILWGLPSAIWTDPATGLSEISYGQPESTVIIRNTAPGTLPELSFFLDCVLNSQQSLANCFYFNKPAAPQILNSKSYANGRLKNAVAILRYGGTNVFGDSYSASSNFYYWGRNLRQAADGSRSNAFWEKTNYNFNPEAQAYWNAGNNAVMAETIERLKASSKSPTRDVSIFGGSQNFQLLARPFDGVCGYATNCSDLATHPEGVLWYTDNYVNSGYSLEISQSLGNLYYQNKGTFLIDKGNLLLTATIDRLPSHPNSQKAALGFIVTAGDVVILNNSASPMTIRASFFVPNGKIIVQGANINLIGSFVAKDFDVQAAGVNFIQDTRGEDSWPPGFREMKMPVVSGF